MPTFRNDTKRWVESRATVQTEDGQRKLLVQFPPGEPKELTFWVPWRKLDLTLVDSEYPPVPQTTLLSGTFDFEPGTERTFQIPPCGRYSVDVIVQSGRARLYAGESKQGAEVVKNDVVPFRYRDVYEWEQAPYLRLVGMEDGTRATLHVETTLFGRIEDLPCR